MKTCWAVSWYQIQIIYFFLVVNYCSVLPSCQISLRFHRLTKLTTTAILQDPWRVNSTWSLGPILNCNLSSILQAAIPPYFKMQLRYHYLTDKLYDLSLIVLCQSNTEFVNTTWSQQLAWCLENFISKYLRPSCLRRFHKSLLINATQFHGVTVSTLDFETSDLSWNLWWNLCFLCFVF